MKRERISTFLGLSLLLFSVPTMAAKGGKGKPPKPPQGSLNPVCVEFDDLGVDNIRSDDAGAYCDVVDNVVAQFQVDNGSNDLTVNLTDSPRAFEYTLNGSPSTGAFLNIDQVYSVPLPEVLGDGDSKAAWDDVCDPLALEYPYSLAPICLEVESGLRTAVLRRATFYTGEGLLRFRAWDPTSEEGQAVNAVTVYLVVAKSANSWYVTPSEDPAWGAIFTAGKGKKNPHTEVYDMPFGLSVCEVTTGDSCTP